MSNRLKTSILFSFLLMSSATTFASENIGVNAAVKGDVTIQSGEQTAKQAVIADPVFLGDVINSNKVGALQVLLVDQTIFTVGPDCELTIDKFIYDPDAKQNAMSATVAKGMFRFMSGNISKSGPDSVSINTPVASMGVRGTMVEGLVGPDAISFAQNAGVIDARTKVDAQGASLFVLRGPGRAHRSNNRKGEVAITAAGKTVVIRQSGLAVFVASKDSPPSQPFSLTNADFQKFNAQLRTAPTGGPSFRPFPVDGYLSGPTRPAGTDAPIGTFDPMRDLDRPADFDFDHGQTSPGTGPSECTPLNPHFPNC